MNSAKFYGTHKEFRMNGFFTYAGMRAKHESTKPIRGDGANAGLIPLGKRNKTQEQLIRKVIGDQVVYACRLYDTDCIEYWPDGSVLIRDGGHNTQTTGKFIHEWSPFACWRQYSQLWVRFTKLNRDVVNYPVSAVGDRYEPYITVDMNGSRQWKRVGKQTVTKQIVDRTAMANARAPMKPFLDYAKATLNMSDGWIMHGTRKEVFVEQGTRITALHRNSIGFNKQLYLAIKEDSDFYVPALCLLLPDHMARETRLSDIEVVDERMPKFGNIPTFKRVFDTKHTYVQLRDAVDVMIKKACDVMMLVEEEPRNPTRSVKRVET
jgi:hypothetical protein